MLISTLTLQLPSFNACITTVYDLQSDLLSLKLTAYSVYAEPLFKYAFLYIFYIYKCFGITTILIIFSLPFEIKYPPTSLSSSLNYTNYYGVLLYVIQFYEPTKIGIIPKF